MKNRKSLSRHIALLTVATTMGLLATVTAQPATASERSPKAESTEDHVEDLDQQFDRAGISQITIHPDSDTAISTEYLSVPTEPNEAVTLMVGSRHSIEIGLPGDGKGDDAVVTSNGSAFFRNVAEDVDLIIQAQNGGGARMVAVLRSSDAPDELHFPIFARNGKSISLTDDGGARILEGDSVVLVIPPPWAYDADGNPVEAAYSADNSTLTLKISHDDDDVYPIFADPWWKRALIGASFGFFGAAVCLPFGPLGAALCSVIFSSASSSLGYR